MPASLHIKASGVRDISEIQITPINPTIFNFLLHN